MSFRKCLDCGCPIGRTSIRCYKCSTHNKIKLGLLGKRKHKEITENLENTKELELSKIYK